MKSGRRWMGKVRKIEANAAESTCIRIKKETSFYWKHVSRRRERISRRADKKLAPERRKWVYLIGNCGTGNGDDDPRSRDRERVYSYRGSGSDKFLGKILGA